MGLIINWILLALSLILIAYIIPGIEVNSLGTAFWAGLIIGLINITIRPILRFISLPVTFLTLGLFAFVVNAFLFWLASAIVPGFEVNGVLPALIGSILLSLLYSLFDRLLPHPMARV